MRLVIWTDAFWPEIGGLEVFCMRLSTALKARGHTCLIIANAPGKPTEEESSYCDIPVHRFAFWDAMGTGDLKKFRSDHEACARVIAEFSPDVIHLNAINKSLMAFVLQHRRKSWPTLLTLHDAPLHGNRHAIGITILKCVNLVATVSESLRHDVLTQLPELADRIHTVPNALPALDVTPAPFPPKFRLLAFGRLVKEKGFDLAIRAFARIADRFPAVTLTIAGDGDQRSYLESMVKPTGLGQRVHFLGWIHPDEIPDLINRHSLIIMPSRWKEPFGLAALQTAQMARPILASRTGGIPEIVLDGITGALFENENLESLTGILQSLLDNPKLCQKMGDQAYLHAQKNFDFNLFVARYENLYAETASFSPPCSRRC